MHLDIEGIPVLFPFDYVYPEQLAYMRELKYSIENRGKFSKSFASRFFALLYSGVQIRFGTESVKSKMKG